MDRLLHLLRSLGPAGATDNARKLLDQRRREALAVRHLERSLASREAAPAVPRQAA